MSLQIARTELDSISDRQKSMYQTNSADEYISSFFFREFIKCTWCVMEPMKLESTNKGDNIVYAVNNSLHYLMYTYLRGQVPAVRVHPDFQGKGVRIALCKNFANNLVKHASFVENDVEYQSWDNVWADIYFQFYQRMGNGKRASHNKWIGNSDYLLQWTEDYLPGFEYNVEQPWFYGWDHTSSFPILYKGSDTKANHIYSFELDYAKFIRVEVLRGDKWQTVVSGGEKYLQFSSKKIPIPELWGNYAFVTGKEVKYNKNCIKGENFMYIRDVVCCDDTNPVKYGTNATVNLQSAAPCLAMFWVAENADARSYRNYSNYTTNTKDISKGWDPISNNTLKYGTKEKLNKLPSDHFSVAQPRHHFPSAPEDPGYHAYSFAWDSTSLHGDITLDLSKLSATLTCEIENNNIFDFDYFTKTNHEEENDMDLMGVELETDKKESNKKKLTKDSPSFTLRARLLVLRKFSINYDEKVKLYDYRVE